MYKRQDEGQAQGFGHAEAAFGGSEAASPDRAVGSGKRISKKIAGLEESGTRLKVQAIVILKSRHRLQYLLDAAGMARSTFFYHQKRLSEPDKHAALKDAIRGSFERNKYRYGYRRVLLDLRNQGWVVNHKLVYKLMREMGLRAKVRQRRRYVSYNGTISHIADNTLDRKFTCLLYTSPSPRD